MTRGVTCPQCGKRLEPGAPDDDKWRPFCSERCKLMDLGDWFTGKHAIPADPEPDGPPDAPAKPKPPQ